MYHGLTREICERAWNIVLPSIAKADLAGIMSKYVGTVVVLDPQSGDVLFEECLGLGDSTKTMRARFSATVYWRLQSTGNDPTTLAGDGVAGRNGVVVAFNGTYPACDQVVAQSILWWILLLMPSDGTIFDSLGAAAEQRMAEAEEFPEM